METEQLAMDKQVSMETDLKENDMNEPNIAEFTNLMDSTLLKLKTSFDNYSTDIVQKMEDLAKRMDDMEKTITNLVSQPCLQDESESAQPVVSTPRQESTAME